VRPWALAAAAVLLLLAVVRPRSLHLVNRAWMAFGTMASTVMTSLLMVVVFYGVVAPVGWLMRRLGHDPLRLQRDAKASTYWIVRDPTPADGMKHQF
jgi:predicted membrane-bound mannosyltransferase